MQLIHTSPSVWLGSSRGIAANADFILVCTYEENGENPELIVYKMR